MRLKNTLMDEKKIIVRNGFEFYLIKVDPLERERCNIPQPAAFDMAGWAIKGCNKIADGTQGGGVISSFPPQPGATLTNSTPIIN